MTDRPVQNLRPSRTSEPSSDELARISGVGAAEPAAAQRERVSKTLRLPGYTIEQLRAMAGALDSTDARLGARALAPMVLALQQIYQQDGPGALLQALSTAEQDPEAIVRALRDTGASNQ